MIKKILKFLGFGILGFIIIIYFFSDQIMYFFDNNKYLNEVLYVKFGMRTTLIVGLILLFVLSFLFFKLLIWLIKTIYKTNEKYNIIVSYDWKDFLASWGIVLSMSIVINIGSSTFNVTGIFRELAIIVVLLSAGYLISRRTAKNRRATDEIIKDDN